MRTSQPGPPGLSRYADPVSRVTVLGAGQALGLTENAVRRRPPTLRGGVLAGSCGYSEHTQWLVDREVAALLTKAETHARDLLTSRR